MKRDEIGFKVSRKGFWMPARVSVLLPSGLILENRGWSGASAMKKALKAIRKIYGSTY